MTYEVKYAFKTNCTTFWNFFVSKWESWKVFDSSEWEKEGIANKGLVFWMSVCLSFIEKNVSFDKKNSIRLSNLTFFISKKKSRWLSPQPNISRTMTLFINFYKAEELKPCQPLNSGKYCRVLWFFFSSKKTF